MRGGRTTFRPHCLTTLALLAAGTASVAQGPNQTFRVVPDLPGDTLLRPMLNLGTNGAAPVGGNVPLPDFLYHKIGAWQPHDAATDLFRGKWTPAGQFFRLDLGFEGMVNPPGTLGCCGNPFDPFAFGPRPLLGYVEIDMDADTNTGGDIDGANMLYLGNVGRFGGLPAHPRLADRVAADGRAFDGDITTPPFVDRSGEEFHIAFHGWEIWSIEQPEPADNVFDAGETWVLTGTLFHRAAGYERFSFACCSAAMGSYNPVVHIRFEHSAELDRTVVSLVYPLTNDGAAAADGTGVPEPLDNVVDNQNSVYEALNELATSAIFANDTDRDDPNFAILEAWQFKNAADYLDPLAWELTFLLGSTIREPASGDVMLAWSDIFPNVVGGDFNGDGEVNWGDNHALEQFIAASDGTPEMDQDGAQNGIVSLWNFIPNFSVCDLNYDGLVAPDDRPVAADFGNYDADADGDVDLLDFWMFQRCFYQAPPTPPVQACATFDGNADGRVDDEDAAGFIGAMTGPG